MQETQEKQAPVQQSVYVDYPIERAFEMFTERFEEWWPYIVTYCVGQATSMAAVLLAAGTKGKQYSLPYSRILIHQPRASGLSGQAADIDIHAREILNQLLADATGQPIDKVERDMNRDYIHIGTSGSGIRIDRVITKRQLPGSST